MVKMGKNGTLGLRRKYVEKSRGLLGDQFLILFFVSKAKVPLCKLLDCLVLESYIALTFMYSTYYSVFEIFFRFL